MSIRKPDIDTLHNSGDFEMVAGVSHARIKDFVLAQVMSDRHFIPGYMIYQTLLFFGGLFFLTRSIVLAVRGEGTYLWVAVAAVLFSLTVLVVMHELLHGAVLKLMGAPKVNFGIVPGKFIFYAEADQFVLGRRQFLRVALTPLIVVQMVTIFLLVAWFDTPWVYFPLMVMVVHSFFCAGDIALVTLFYRFQGREVYTYDSRKEKMSYYFVEKDPASSVLNSSGDRQ